MNRALRKRLRILLERAKVPRRLVRGILHLTGQYRRGLRNAHEIQLRKIDLALERLPAAFHGYQILVMSDLHIDSELHLVPRIKEIVANTRADACFLLGDYRYRLSGPDDLLLKRISEIIKEVDTTDGIYAVRGNHDSKDIMLKLGQLGMQILDNQSVSLQRGEQSLAFVGVDEPHYDKEDDLPLALSHTPQNVCKILLAHTSEIYHEAADLGIDLYLCGHTHGGQICIKGLGPIITNAHAPRRFARGFWSHKQMIGYTSTGVGASAVPVRFNCPPEIVLFTLREKEKDGASN